MQMRGSRVLAFTATVLGFVGLSLGLVGGPLAVAGLAVAAAALLGLLAIAWMALDAAPGPPPQAILPAMVEFEQVAAPPPPAHEAIVWEPAPNAAPPPPPPAGMEEPAIDLDSPLQRALAGLPPRPSAPARYSPRMPVIPTAEAEPEPVRRARRLVPSGQTLGEKREAARKAQARPPGEEVEFTVVAAKQAAARPSVEAAPKAPVVVARVAGKGAAPPSMARGKCGGCSTFLW
ncbi:MAG TPA: hypothetical protein VHI93_08430, partial [Candidatus Thermoplasmatota archaeon]|nr:hypothetical protein [Candidatus Thermoplasmatota archaeon]